MAESDIIGQILLGIFSSLGEPVLLYLFRFFVSGNRLKKYEERIRIFTFPSGRSSGCKGQTLSSCPRGQPRTENIEYALNIHIFYSTFCNLFDESENERLYLLGPSSEISR